MLEVILSELPANQTIVEVLSASQVSGNFTTVRIIDDTGGACPRTGGVTITATSVLMLLDANVCNPGAGKHSDRRKHIIVGAVMGAVVLGIVVAAVLWFLRKHFKARGLFRAQATEKAWVI